MHRHCFSSFKSYNKCKKKVVTIIQNAMNKNVTITWLVQAFIVLKEWK